MTLPHKGCLSLHSCQTAMLPHVGKLNSAYSAFSFNIHSSNRFSCSIKFFRLKIAIGLALGESVFATKTIPHGAPLPTEHSIYNIYDNAWDWL